MSCPWIPLALERKLFLPGGGPCAIGGLPHGRSRLITRSAVKRLYSYPGLRVCFPSNAQER